MQKIRSVQFIFIAILGILKQQTWYQVESLRFIIEQLWKQRYWIFTQFRNHQKSDWLAAVTFRCCYFKLKKKNHSDNLKFDAK